jgi:hypothetical protein
MSKGPNDNRIHRPASKVMLAIEVTCGEPLLFSLGSPLNLSVDSYSLSMEEFTFLLICRIVRSAYPLLAGLGRRQRNNLN